MEVGTSNLDIEEAVSPKKLGGPKIGKKKTLKKHLFEDMSPLKEP